MFTDVRCALVGILAAGMLACGRSSGGTRASLPLPIGVWEVADPAEAARRLLPGHRAAAQSNPALVATDQELYAKTLHYLESIVVEFRSDGTVVHSAPGPWKAGRWNRTGDDVVVVVERYGDVATRVPITYRISGDSLGYVFLYGELIGLKRSSRVPSGSAK
jgi:hypothetical protein